jgi:hypothetical protein
MEHERLPSKVVAERLQAAHSRSKWLAPLGMSGLFRHTWFDGRIWTRRSLNA